MKCIDSICYICYTINIEGVIDMIKKAILKLQKESGASPHDIMSAFIYGAIWALVLVGSIYPMCWVIVKIAEITGKI